MPQSLAKNLLHLVFSTKNRQPVLSDAVRPELHRYMAGIFRDLDSPVLTLNSVADHIHILFNLHRTKALADVVMEVKRGSSKWVKTKAPEFAEFHWQGGYGAFSVSQSSIVQVSTYIQLQERHHQQQDFKAELLALLQRHEMDYDEQYLWD